MIRSLHRWPGLIAALLLVVLAGSGAVLSVLPASEALRAAQADVGLSVADLAERVAAAYPGVEQIRRAPSGRITAYFFVTDRPDAAVIDPATGLGLGSADTPAFQRWVTSLHRSLFLGDAGRIAVAFGAGAMLVLSLTGLRLVARRTGGWRRFFAPLKGPLAGRVHVEVARATVAGLVLSSATALWMAASTFDLLPAGPGAPPIPRQTSGQTGFPPADMPLLMAVPVSSLRELIFPYPGDVTDVFTLTTDAGVAYIDQGTGELLAWTGLGGWEKATEIVYGLHTGQGAAILGLLLGVMALGVPLMAGTGVILWTQGRRGRPRISANASPGQADTILLVGSESGGTWGFAATLHAALAATGQRVHAAPLSAFAPARYARAGRLIVLTATYGDGGAPASAKGFLDRLAALPQAPRMPFAVLGFGDRQFPAFCGFAEAVERTAVAKRWAKLLPLDTVDRQSSQDFTRWGQALGATLGVDLALSHQPVAPKARTLTLISRRAYGEMVQAPTAILRFALPGATLWDRLTGHAFPRFAAGDLLGIVPEGSSVPRFYSLASASGDGFAEICVRKHSGGLCSGQLLDLGPGETARAFIRRNPEFRPAPGRQPVILIGAGTGIGPLAGFARANRSRRAMHLYFGARHPESDLLYGEELLDWRADGRLSSITATFSRTAARAYVQDALRHDGEQVARLIVQGALVMVCGGREMAAGVAAALADILAPLGLTPAMLKLEGRYAEDIY